MRCSRFAITLIRAAIAVGALGIATAGSPTGMAAQIGANPALGQAVNRFESVKDWRNHKFMEELANDGAKESFPLSLLYKIAMAKAAEYAAKIDAAVEGDSFQLKSIFSAKMLTLLSARWDDKSSTAMESVSEEEGDAAQDADEYADDSSYDMEDDANAAEELSANEGLFMEWTSPDFFDSSLLLDDERRSDGSFGYPYHAAENRFDPEESEADYEAVWQARLNTLSEILFPSPPPSGEEYAGEKNAGEENPEEEYAGEEMIQDEYAGEGDRGDEYAGDETGEGSEEEDYSMKSGNAAEDIDDQTQIEEAEEATEGEVEEADEEFADEESDTEAGITPEPPQSAQNGSSGSCLWDAETALNHYLGCETFFNPANFAGKGVGSVFDHYGDALKIGPETLLFGTFATLPGFYGERLIATNGQDQSPGVTNHADPLDAESAEESSASLSPPHTLLNRLVDGIKNETSDWFDAFHRIARQFSSIREAF